jgi:hypothetical protein
LSAKILCTRRRRSRDAQETQKNSLAQIRAGSTSQAEANDLGEKAIPPQAATRGLRPTSAALLAQILLANSHSPKFGWQFYQV